MSDNILKLNQEVIHNEIKDLVKSSIKETLNAMLDAEVDQLVKAERYAHDEQRQGYRAGHYERGFTTTAGDVTLKISKLKGFAFETSIIERYKRRETSVEEALIEMYLTGVSVHRVEDITEALWDTRVSPGTISNLNKKAYENIEQWCNRPIEENIRMFMLTAFFSNAAGANRTKTQKLRNMKLVKAAKKVEESVHETFTYMKFPSEHWTRIRTNNTHERLNREIKCRTKEFNLRKIIDGTEI